MPWKIIAVATTPATSIVEKSAEAAPVPPTAWPMRGKT